jgi:urea transport system substrate-binding protein
VQGGYKGLIAGTLFDDTLALLYGGDAKGIICVQDYYAAIDDPFSKREAGAIAKKYPKASFGSATNGPAWYRGIHMWKAAVEKAGSTDLTEVNDAMDSIAVEKLIGGPARMVPGTRHCELSMYLAEMQANGPAKVLKDLGAQAPKGQCT